MISFCGVILVNNYITIYRIAKMGYETRETKPDPSVARCLRICARTANPIIAGGCTVACRFLVPFVLDEGCERGASATCAGAGLC